MAKKYDEIVDDINTHLTKSSRKYYSDFYIGVSNNATKSLFEDHHVDAQHTWWIYRTATSASVARDVQSYFIDLGMRGENKIVDTAAKMVYCYAVGPTTSE